MEAAGEAFHPMQADIQRQIHAIQLKGLRCIIKLEATFVNRRKTNEPLLQKANAESFMQIELFSGLLWQKQANLAGHGFRRN